DVLTGHAVDRNALGRTDLKARMAGDVRDEIVRALADAGLGRLRARLLLVDDDRRRQHMQRIPLRIQTWPQLVLDISVVDVRPAVRDRERQRVAFAAECPERRGLMLARRQLATRAAIGEQTWRRRELGTGPGPGSAADLQQCGADDDDCPEDHCDQEQAPCRLIPRTQRHSPIATLSLCMQPRLPIVEQTLRGLARSFGVERVEQSTDVAFLDHADLPRATARRASASKAARIAWCARWRRERDG